MLNAAVGILLLSLLQAVQTGTVIGIVKAPTNDTPVSARAVLLPAKYTEIWNRQVQTRLDNYWEIFKPEFVKDKEHFLNFHRMAQVEAFRYVTSNMRRDLGDAASKFMKETSPTGQFDFTGRAGRDLYGRLKDAFDPARSLGPWAYAIDGPA